MVHICSSCKFLFSRTEEPDACPDCGKSTIREANEAEELEFNELRAEFEYGDK